MTVSDNREDDRVRIMHLNKLGVAMVTAWAAAAVYIPHECSAVYHSILYLAIHNAS